MKRLITLILCLIGMAVSIQAQTLSGKLVDEKNEPLAYANVVLLSLPDSTFVSGTISDEMGGFRLMKEEKGELVRISSIGYATIYKKVNGGDFGIIPMTSDTQLLGEVVVKGNLPVTRVKGDALVTSVAGTLLEKAGTAEDLLNKIPNVTAENGSVKVFGRGTPEIYINGRKVRDTNELDRLESDNIKSVEVINNPGARYDASVTSVIRIITKKAQGDGFGFNNRTYVSYNEKWTGLEQIDMNYRTGGFDFGGMVRYWNTYRIEDYTSTKHTYLDKELKQDINNVGENRMKRLGTQLSVNYTFNPNHSVGLRHDFTRSPDSNSRWVSDDKIYRDDILEETGRDDNRAYSQNHRHTVNVYYAGKVKEWTIDFNADGMWYRNRERDWNETHYSPIGEEEKELLVTTFTRNTHNLYAAKLVFTHPMAGGTLSFGGEYSHSKRTNLYTNPQGILADDDSYSKEGIASGFVEYERKIGRVNLQAGVRVEHVAFDYYIKNIRRDDMSRTSDDFFPSLALSFPLGKMQMQLGYAKDIQRPAFKQLSGEINYSNRYTYQTGNPLLRPTMTDNITLNAIYRWASLSVGYQHIKDKMLYTTEVYSEDTPDAILLSQGNYPSYDRCYASLTLTPKAGLWSPQLSGQFTKQWMELVTPNGAVRANEPIFSIVWRNGFKLPAGFIVNANAYWQGKGYRENTYIAKSIWKMDFSIQKSFFKERLSVHLNATNAFRTYRGRTCMTTDLQTWTQRYNNSQYAYTMNIRYKFNTTKSKYKGTGAGAGQKARM